MAVGNTGEYLEFAADAMCTWLSRDGGATWEDVAPNAVRSDPLCPHVRRPYVNSPRSAHFRQALFQVHSWRTAPTTICKELRVDCVLLGHL